MVGHPIGMFWGYQILGVFQTEEDVQNHVNENGVLLQPRATPGDFIFADIAGAFDEDGNPIPDGRINAEDRTFIGNPHPKAVYGASLNMAYRGFDLNIFLQGQYGNDIFMYQKYWNNQGYRDGFNQVSGLEEISWNGPGSTNSHPIINHRKTDNQRLTEWWLSDGSYMRVKNVTLAYNLPNNILNNIRVKGAQIYITGENLFTFTKYEGLDPEIGAAGATSAGDWSRLVCISCIPYIPGWCKIIPVKKTTKMNKYCIEPGLFKSTVSKSRQDHSNLKTYNHE
jgi:TonB-dependent starch-binding outer membrane protein SusC